jgi:hypothetical protein
MKNIALFFILSVTCGAQNYKAGRTLDHDISVIRMTDVAQGVEVSIAPAMGNRTYEMKVHGKNILYFLAPDISQVPKAGGLNGIPFFAPWANRTITPGRYSSAARHPSVVI